MRSIRRLSLSLPALVLAVGAALCACHSYGSGCGCPCQPSCQPAAQSAAPRSAPVAAAPMTFASQAAQGARVYAASCARCHGPAGQGSAGAPALVGPSALPGTPPAGRKFRTMPFKTVGDVEAFVASSMPPGGPALSSSDAWAVIAFALQANGVKPERPLDAASAAGMPLGR